jgi:hypothetical protein
MQRLTETLPSLWQETKWKNTRKEAYRRLTIGGVPLLGNSHRRRTRVARCGCGVRPGQGESRDTPISARRPVAQAVVGDTVRQVNSNERETAPFCGGRVGSGRV